MPISTIDSMVVQHKGITNNNLQPVLTEDISLPTEPKGLGARNTTLPQYRIPLSQVTTTESRVSQCEHISNNDLPSDLI